MRDAATNLRALPEQRDLIDQVHFPLDADKFQQFTDLLDAPPQPNTGLERLFALKPDWNRLCTEKHA